MAMVALMRVGGNLFLIGHRCRCEDLWSNLVDNMSAYLETSPLRIPGGLKEDATSVPAPSRLGRDYFKLISAVEYTRKMDDGANPHEWKVKQCSAASIRLLFIYRAVHRKGLQPSATLPFLLPAGA